MGEFTIPYVSTLNAFREITISFLDLPNNAIDKNENLSIEFPYEIQSGHGCKGYTSQNNIEGPTIIITVITVIHMLMMITTTSIIIVHHHIIIITIIIIIIVVMVHAVPSLL